MCPELHPNLTAWKLNWFAGSILLLLVLGIYLHTLAPGVYGFDSAELATGVYTQGIIHPPGYPVYLLVGKLFTLIPIGDIAYRLNLMSAVFGSMTVIALYWIMAQVVESRFAAWISAFLFAVSNYFWQMALIAEVYTFHTAVLVGLLLIVWRWRITGYETYILLFSLLYGLSLAIHTSGILYAPAFIWWILKTPLWKKSYWRLVPAMFLLFLIGLSPYAYLSLRAGLNPLVDYIDIYPGIDIATLSGLWWLISGKAYAIFTFAYAGDELQGEVIRFMGFLWRNYLGIGVIFGLAGIPFLWHRKRSWTVGLLLFFAANVLFFVNYRVLDKDTMFLPAYMIWAFFISSGLAFAEELIERGIRFDFVKAWTQILAKSLMVVLVVIAMSLNWRWVDMSDADGYAVLARETLSRVEPNSVVIAPWSSAVVLEYYQIVEGIRPDILIINRSRRNVARYYEFWQTDLSHDEIMSGIAHEEQELIDHYIQQRTIYAIEYDPALADKFEYLPDGAGFKLGLR